MASSRDDFIIAVRSAFLQKGNQQRFSLIGLIFFSILLLILGSFNFKIINYLKIGIKDIVYRSSFIISGPENFLKNIHYTTNKHFKLYKEYNSNLEELGALKSKDLLNEAIVLDYYRLKDIINDYLFTSEETVAKILIDKKSPFLRSVIANKGSKDNIKLGMVVTENGYLIGKVVEVNYLTSRILLLSDLNSKIPVRIEPSGIQSILSGTGEDSGVIQYQKERYTIDNGSTIYTSGYGDLFQAGIPIGKVDYSISAGVKNVVFFSDFSQLRFVKILDYKKTSFGKSREVEDLERIKKEKIEILKKNEILEEQKKLDTKAKIEADKILYEKKLENDKLKKELELIKTKKINKTKLEEKIKEEKTIYKKLEKKYRAKCKKNFIFTKLYVVGTPEYKACILRKGSKIE